MQHNGASRNTPHLSFQIFAMEKVQGANWMKSSFVLYLPARLYIQNWFVIEIVEFTAGHLTAVHGIHRTEREPQS